MRNLIGTALVAIALTTGLSLSARADETGVAAIHAWVRVGAKICFQSHEHFGESASPQPNKRLALRAAIANWAGFTAWEYGTDWGTWRLAAGKRVGCTGQRGAVVCKLVARPCKRAARSVRRRMRRR